MISYDLNKFQSAHKLEDGILVRYIYSACIVTETQDVKILHDPWFTQGIYDGSWFHFPLVSDPIDKIGDVDFIYISHIHPDHYDAFFLESYFKKFGNKTILIANHSPNHLAKKIQDDGFSSLILKDLLKIGNTQIQILPHVTGSKADIDSAIVIKHISTDKIHCIVNTNDIIYDNSFISKLKNIAGDIDILLCGYTGAGPYPQTYFDKDDSDLLIECSKKKEDFFLRYKSLTSFMNSKVNIPFAGQYVLGGKLVDLNSFRGVSDPVEILEFDKRAVILADLDGNISTLNLIPENKRIKKYDLSLINQRLDEIKSYRMDYERLFSSDEIGQLPILKLLFISSQNAIAKSEYFEDYFFCFSLPDNLYAVINANKNGSKNIEIIKELTKLPTPRSEIYIDPRYFFGLLTKIYHWNNAQIGSQFITRRIPNIFNRNAQKFLNFLSV